jgi:hypothetical protein
MLGHTPGESLIRGEKDHLAGRLCLGLQSETFFAEATQRPAFRRRLIRAPALPVVGYGGL